MALSEQSWRSSVSLRHQMAIAHPQHPRIPLFPAQKLDDFGKYPYTLWDFFPATYTCPHDIQRVGRLGDGGKWVCGMSLYESREARFAPAITQHKTRIRSETIIYSFGVNDESTFEAEMLSRIPSAHSHAGLQRERRRRTQTLWRGGWCRPRAGRAGAGRCRCDHYLRRDWLRAA